MDTAERLCDSICLINHGRAVLEGDLGKIRAGYGKRNVQIKYEGDAKFLQDPKLVQSFNDYGNYVEVRLAAGADPQDCCERRRRVRAAQQVRADGAFAGRNIY
jgi:ABC-2 type transport system ATP-binding protein